MKLIYKKLIDFGVNPIVAEYLSVGIMIIFIVLLCLLANFITKKIVIRFITHIVNNNKYTWDNILLEKKVFHKLSHIVPAIIIYHFAEAFTYQDLIEKGAITYIIIVVISLLGSLLNAFHEIYLTYEISKVQPIKGYIQVAKIIVYVLGIILIIANLIGKNPLIILSGLGALSAVLLLVFKDSLLGLVAGIQLTSNDMVRVGDWIEMPKYGADGDVIDLSLNTVKVQNFDKTITTIPSYALISDSFKNWRGMQVTGGRRIKRSLFIDTTSIAFCSREQIEKLRNIHYLTDYIDTRQREITEYNIKHRIDTSNQVNGRALTNVGLFRTYISNYLKNHPGIHKEMTTMVRQLAPNEYGLPIEIYAFSNDINWAVYESIQSDIFDHLFAIASEFDLRLFQNPTGNDFKAMSSLHLNNHEGESN
ncbi:small-conductance mechanosensitive channel [Solibacillus silvestris StLB046]|uniref:Mechanosensing system component YbdG n=1 Tax=Solibacillus silvestris (strain StLB046) TaxID=1002809 RepID=F2F5M8_SOLSS|nr:mechanosensitive ion channel domain-containing protein [Solibacillus silvestris]BAK16561.1 small-conductance mechanosensitive channel [Solibacillus silvestris StLB046]